VDVTEVDALLAKEIEKNETKIVVLDDDPTGVQTVHDISVYTDWSKESIQDGFAEENKLFYVLTNSRGFTVEQTTKAHKEIAAVVAEVAKETGKNYMIMSRSDSTLRGHYPLETNLLKEEMEANSGIKTDGEIMCPFFPEGGRFTIDNVHYVKYGEELVPAGETEFAKDKTFGYTSSDLPSYVEEKTSGAYKAKDVTCISLEDLRALNIDKIEEQLTSVENFNKIVVNAVDYVDVKVFCIALYRAIAKGKNYMFRTAAALVKVIGGVTDQPLLTRKEMVTTETSNGGIVVVGSHTQKTTAQLNQLLTLKDVEPIEFNSNLVLEGDEAFDAEINRVVALSEKLISEGKTPVCFTNRTLLVVENDTKEDALVRSVKISDGVQSLVGRLSITPAFVIAKGGITSSDVGTKALAVKKANVMGQIKPGIPVWQTGEESKFPGIPYIIFPGNVGEESTLKEAVEVLQEV
jgi:uncharacterized protein YgbK (DUF1537 family)